MFGDLVDSNKYLHALSSNYPNATSHTSPGALNTELKGKSYYLAAKDADGLSAAFKGITEEISSGGSAITLDATAVLKDVISDQFELDIDKSRDRVIKVYTAACTGKNDDGYTFAERVESDLTPTVSGNTVSVTGFDYAKNWVGEEKKNDVVIGYHGTKLILEIPIKAKDGFMGGNQVETNAPGSGVFNGDEVVEEFVSPKVDVDAKPLSIIDTEWNVYLKGDLTKEQLIDGAEVQKAIDALDPWQKEYVEFETTIVDSNGNVVTDFSDLTEDETYTVKVTTVPTGEGTAASAEARGNAEVNVFMPTITFKDSAVNAGETPNYNDNFVSLVWKHDDVESTTVKMTGTEPTLTYTYDPTAAPISNETNVKVTVTMDNDNIHNYVTFYREACTGQDWSCGFTGREVDANAEDRINFVVHVKTFDLIIQKQGADADPGAAFVFNIKGEGIDMDVVIYGNGSVTIKDLPSGRYTISETAGYWRYKLADDQTIDTSVTAPVDGKLTTTFTNTHDTDKWLDAIAHATNVFGSNS